VATDHCSFTIPQKRMGAKDFTKIPNGTGGLEDRMPVLWTAGVNTGRLTKEEFVAVTSTNIARILNIYPRKGAVMPGADADIVIWDPKATKTITAKKQVSRIEYNVFEGFHCTGVPRLVLSRGRIAWAEGDMRARPGDGDFVAREPNAPVQAAHAIWKGRTRPQGVRRVEVTP
jgi:dihydropyrimidinase